MSGDGFITLPVVGQQFSYYENRWSRFRSLLRQPLAEFLGTLLFVLFGLGGVCQVALSSSAAVSPGGSKRDYLFNYFGWGVGICMGVWVSGGISGAHLNPAITLAFAILRRFSWIKAATYWLSQLLGGFVGAAIVYGNYRQAIDLARSSSGLDPTSFFVTSPASYISPGSAFLSEFLCAALFVLAVFSVTDSDNCAPPAGLVPFALGLVYIGIDACFGLNTGGSINPIRDLAPRLLLSAIGYRSEVWTGNS